ncbi:MAG: hypothetical protein PHE29_14235 [Tissierellia bacterium]|nr:hypothetical protein [Tissierellia bacterium]
MAKKEDVNIYYCVGCGKTHQKTDFYVSYSPHHANGRVFYCKNYIKNKVYRLDGTIDLNKLKTLLRHMDIAFVDEIWESSLSEDRETVGVYFKNINMVQNRGLTWSDSSVYNETTTSEDNVESNFENKIENTQDNLYRKSKDVTQEELIELENKWGSGYNREEYILFERKYQLLKNNYTEKTAMHTEALYNYIRYRVKEELSTAEGNVGEAKAWGALASKAATDAKINPSQLSKADLSDGLSTFSELSQAVEKEVDIIRILPKFKYRPNDALDFNIWCYINYARDLAGLPACDYEDVYSFYDAKIEDYVQQYGDPYEIFKDDTTIKNRESIKNFIKTDGDD